MHLTYNSTQSESTMGKAYVEKPLNAQQMSTAQYGVVNVSIYIIKLVLMTINKNPLLFFWMFHTEIKLMHLFPLNNLACYYNSSF